MFVGVATAAGDAIASAVLLLLLSLSPLVLLGVSFFLLEIRLCRMQVRVLLLSLRSLVLRSCYTSACCCCRRCVVDFNGEYLTFPVVSDIKSTRKTGRVVNREGHLEEKSKNREPDNEAVLSKGKTRLNRLLSAGFDRLPKTG